MEYHIDIAELPLLARDFAGYKSTIQGCSNKTVNQYLFDLRIFFRYLRARDMHIPLESDEMNKIDVRDLDAEYICAVTTSDIYNFMLYVGAQRKNQWSAKSRKLSAIKGFYKYLVTKSHAMEKNPAADIDTPKPKKTLPKFLTLQESLDLLNAVESDVDSPWRVRDYAIITLFLNCGMRVSELVGVNLGDIDRELRSMRVTGKGSKERIIYLNDACRTALQKYLDQRLGEAQRSCTEKALFLSNRQRRVSVQLVQHIVYKYLQRAGLESRHLSVHKLRHTAATLMYQSGKVDIRVLKDILGHEQLNTTQIYTHISDANMQRAMDNNPLADIKKK